MAEGGPTRQTQIKTVQEGLQEQLEKDATWYILDIHWFKQWKSYTGFDKCDPSLFRSDEASNPGPVDNSAIICDEGHGPKLKEKLIEELDYVLVPEKVWRSLVDWFGLAPNQEPLARKVIEQGMYVKHFKVEVYLVELKLCEFSQLNTTLPSKFSRTTTLEDICKRMRELFSIPDETEVRLWARQSVGMFDPLNKLQDSLHEAGLYHGQAVVIEKQLDDGTWERRTNRTTNHGQATTSSTSAITGPVTSVNAYTTTRSYSNTTNPTSFNNRSQFSYGYDYGRVPSTPGLCGLSNLGNTCFMNSALQCMGNVPLLTDYFLSTKWQEELNERNPLGMHGEIAKSYADLMRNMWSGHFSFTIPKQFKISVGRFAPQFSGYNQQDSQELMAFLLDGLHEDLNRIKKKPYVELKESDGRPDNEVSKEAWVNYKKRNDSIIVDTFHGLLKSTLVCPECSKISVTFDPFCYLSLPLPVKKERNIEIIFVPLGPEKTIIRYKVTVFKNGNISDLCVALSQLCGIPPNKMVVTDVYSHKFHKVFAFEDAISTILDRDDIFVYELPDSVQDKKRNVIAVYMRQRNQSTPSYILTNQLFGIPFIVTVPMNCTYAALYEFILHHMSRYVKSPDPGDKWWLADDNDNVSETASCSMNGEIETASEASLYDQTKPDNDTQQQMEATSPATELENGHSPILNGHEKENGASETEESRRLFTLSVVNNFGSQEIDKIQDNGKPLKLSSRTYIAIDWDPRAKAKFYDEKLSEEFHEHDSMMEKPKEKKQVIQLTDCLELFTTTEKLGHNDLWYCPQCKKHQQATKKFDIWDLPDVLVIHLKRFSYERTWRDKIDALVDFPLRGLSLKDYLINPEYYGAVYDLQAVSNHYGGLGGGHYTAFAKNKMNGDWYYFDDSSVSRSSEDAVVTKASYVLVYQRRSASKAATSAAVASGDTSEIGGGVVNGTENLENIAPNHNNAEAMDTS